MKKTYYIFSPEDHMDKLYNSKNYLVKFVHQNRLETIIKSVPKSGGLKILDAGCGEGHLIEKMFRHNSKNFYYGVDFNGRALKKAKKRCPGAIFQKMDIAKIKFADEFFDVVVCTEVLEHIINYEDVLQEFKRVLKKNGYLIVTFPNEPIWTFARFLLGRRPIKIGDHFNSFDSNQMKSTVKMKLVYQVSLPFKFVPFFSTLGVLMKFKK